MPYDPHAPDNETRSKVYEVMKAGLIGSLVVVAANAVEIGRVVEGLAALQTGALIGSLAFWNRFDEHFQSLCAVGYRWAGGVIGAWLTVQALLTVIDGAYATGTTAGGSVVTGSPLFLVPEWFNRAFLLASLSSTAFFAGFVWAERRESL